MIDRERVLAELKHSEGCRLEAYLDTEGVPTIGWGSVRYARAGQVGTGQGTTRHVARGDAVREGDCISQEYADEELRLDMLAACQDLDQRLPWTERLPTPALESLVRMSFQLGISRLCGFRRMLAALRRGDYAEAVLEGFDSRWARQTPKRAVRVLRGFVVADRAIHD